MDSSSSAENKLIDRTPTPVFLGIDWSKTDLALATALNCGLKQVKAMRLAELGPPKKRKGSRNAGRKKINRANDPVWQEREMWDWNLTDAQLGRKHNFSRERMRQMRKLLNKPPTPTKGQFRGLALENHGKIIDWSMSNEAIAAEFGIKIRSVQFRRRNMKRREGQETRKQLP